VQAERFAHRGRVRRRAAAAGADHVHTQLLHAHGVGGHHLGRTAVAELVADQLRQAGGLAAGGAHILLFETFSDLGEVRAGVEGARRAAPDLPVAVTMTFDLKGHTMMGVSPSQALAEISALGVELIGGNCGSGPDEIEAVMVTMSAERPDGVLLLAQSNAGLPQLVGDEFRYGGTPEVMADYAVRMQELGVDVIGSCCGSTPSHTAAMREALGLPAVV